MAKNDQLIVITTKKTKMLSTAGNYFTNIAINGIKIEEVEEFSYLGKLEGARKIYIEGDQIKNTTKKKNLQWINCKDYIKKNTLARIATK